MTRRVIPGRRALAREPGIQNRGIMNLDSGPFALLAPLNDKEKN